MTRYFMRDTPLQQMEQQMMTPPSSSGAIAYITQASDISPRMWTADTARTSTASTPVP